MAYRSGYVTGYSDSSDEFLFKPTTDGYSMPINKEITDGHSLWGHYGKAIPVQQHIIYTSGVSALYQTPSQSVLDGADSGSGNGDKMIYRTPSDPGLPISDAEALVIIADGTYKDAVTQ